MARQTIFAQKEIKIQSEIVSIKVGSLNGVTLNSARILTEMDLAQFGSDITFSNAPPLAIVGNVGDVHVDKTTKFHYQKQLVLGIPTWVFQFDATGAPGLGLTTVVDYTELAIQTITPGNGVIIGGMSVRGNIVPSPFNYAMAFTRLNNVVFLILPAFSVTLDAGGDPSTNVDLGTLPLALRPRYTIQHAVNMVDNSLNEPDSFSLHVLTSGVVRIIPPNLQNLQTSWGFSRDVHLSYVVGLP